MRVVATLFVCVALAAVVSAQISIPPALRETCQQNVNCFYGQCSSSDDWCHCFSGWGGCRCLEYQAPPATAAACSPSHGTPPPPPPPPPTAPVAPAPVAPVAPAAPTAPGVPVGAVNSSACDCLARQSMYVVGSDNPAAGDTVYQYFRDGTRVVCAANSPGQLNFFYGTRDIEVDSRGNIYVVSRALGVIVRIDAGCGAKRVIYRATEFRNMQGALPSDIAFDDQDRLYVSTESRTLWRLQLSSAGTITGEQFLYAGGFFSSLTWTEIGLFAVRNRLDIVVFVQDPVFGFHPQLYLNAASLGIVDTGQVAVSLSAGCEVLVFAADDNNQVFMCDDFTNGGSCHRGCGPLVDSSTCQFLQNPNDVAIDCECTLFATNNGVGRIVTLVNGFSTVFAPIFATGIVFFEGTPECTSFFVTFPPDAFLTLDDNCMFNAHPSNTGTPTVGDSCDGNSQLSYTDNTSNIGPDNTGFILRTWRAQHVCGGQAAVRVQTIYVNDFTPPNLIVPGPITLDCTQDYTNTGVTGTPTVSDACVNCGSSFTFSDSIVGGGCPETFTVTRTFTATDCHNNQATATQIITVRDTTAPTFSFFPADISVQCDDCITPGVCVPGATAIDDCDTTPTVTFTDQNAGPNTIVRTWRACDNCNNCATRTQTIQTGDNTAPNVTISIPPISCCPTSLDPCNTGNLVVTDNCDTGLTPTYSDTCNHDPAQPCFSEVICIRTWQVCDLSGNCATLQQRITRTINITSVVI